MFKAVISKIILTCAAMVTSIAPIYATSGIPRQTISKSIAVNISNYDLTNPNEVRKMREVIRLHVTRFCVGTKSSYPKIMRQQYQCVKDAMRRADISISKLKRKAERPKLATPP